MESLDLNAIIMKKRNKECIRNIIKIEYQYKDNRKVGVYKECYENVKKRLNF